MSKPTRSVKEIQKEYNQVLVNLGYLNWQLEKIPNQLEDIKRQLRTLDREADEAQKAEIKVEQAKIQASLSKQKDPKANGIDKHPPKTDVLDESENTEAN